MADVIDLVIDELSWQLTICARLPRQSRDLLAERRAAAEVLLKVLQKVNLSPEHLERLIEVRDRGDDGVSKQINDLIK